MNNCILDEEIIALYTHCGVDVASNNIPKNTINTGNLHNLLNYGFHSVNISSANTDRLRWE